MTNWYEQKEQSAGLYRLNCLWYIYRFLGKRVLKFIVSIVVFFIWLFAKPAKTASRQYRFVLNDYQKQNGSPVARFSTYRHILSYANSLVDKLDIAADSKLSFEIEQTPDAQYLNKLMKDNQGVFFICSHLGNIECLPAIGKNPNHIFKKMHAFMQTSQSAIFHTFMQKHLKSDRVCFHPTEQIDISVAAQMQDNLKKGEFVMMAADRISAGTPQATLSARLLNKEIHLPKGVFRFAHLMETPTFFIVCVLEKNNRYRVFVKTVPNKNPEQAYADFLQNLILKYPTQWYNFYDFFHLDK